MKNLKNQKGITLVALVVTIIILLILAGVTLNGALSENGLFQRAKRAANEYKKAEEEETKAIDEIGEEIDRITFTYNDYVGCYVDGYTPKANGTCTINGTASGTEQEQTFTTDTGIKWRIWDYNKSTNTIRLISDKPTTDRLTLDKVNGYNNGVWAINEICRNCYAMKDESGRNIKGLTVANLRRTDIQKVSTYDYTQYRHKDSNENNSWHEVTDGTTENTIQFGEAKTYETSQGYPKMWGDHDKNWTYERKNDGTIIGKDDETIWEQEYDGQGNLSETGNTEKTFKQSYYWHIYDKDEFIKDKYCDLIFGVDGDIEDGMMYYLAGRCTHLVADDYCEFDLDQVSCGNNKLVSAHAVCTSANNHGSYSAHLRPIVSINLTDSNYELVKQEKTEDNQDIKFTLQRKTE